MHCCKISCCFLVTAISLFSIVSTVNASSLSLHKTKSLRRHPLPMSECKGGKCARDEANHSREIRSISGRISNRLLRGSCTSNNSACHHRCINIGRSYHRCACNHGYRLLSNQRSCWKARRHAQQRPVSISDYNIRQRNGQSRSAASLQSSLRTRTRSSTAPTTRLPLRHCVYKEPYHRATPRPRISDERLRSYQHRARISHRRHRFVSNRRQLHRRPSNIVSSRNRLERDPLTTPSSQVHPNVDSVSIICDESVADSRHNKSKSSGPLVSHSNVRGSHTSRLSRYRLWTRNRRKMSIESKPDRPLLGNANEQKRIGESRANQTTNTSRTTSKPGKLNHQQHGKIGDLPLDRMGSMEEREETPMKTTLTPYFPKSVEGGRNFKDDHIAEPQSRKQSSTKSKLADSMQADQGKLYATVEPHPSEDKDNSSTKNISPFLSKSHGKVPLPTESVDEKKSQNSTSRIRFAKMPNYMELLKATAYQAQHSGAEGKGKTKENTRTPKTQSLILSPEEKAIKEYITRNNFQAGKDGIDAGFKINGTIIKPTRIRSQKTVSAESTKRPRGQSKLNMRQKMLSSLREQLLDRRMAALLRRRRLQRGQHGRMVLASTSSPRTETTPSPLLPSSSPSSLSSSSSPSSSSSSSSPLNPTTSVSPIVTTTTTTTATQPAPTTSLPRLFSQTSQLPRPIQRTRSTPIPKTLQTNEDIDRRAGSSYTRSPVFDMAINHRHRASALASRALPDKRQQGKQQHWYGAKTEAKDTMKQTPDFLPFYNSGYAVSQRRSRPHFTSGVSRSQPKFYCPEGQRVFSTPVGNVCVPNSHRAKTQEPSKVNPMDLCPQAFVPQATHVGASCNLPKGPPMSSRKHPNSDDKPGALRSKPRDLVKTTKPPEAKSTTRSKGLLLTAVSTTSESDMHLTSELLSVSEKSVSTAMESDILTTSELPTVSERSVSTAIESDIHKTSELPRVSEISVTQVLSESDTTDRMISTFPDLLGTYSTDYEFTSALGTVPFGTSKEMSTTQRAKVSFAETTSWTPTIISALSGGEVTDPTVLQASKLCPPGQIVINTPEGRRCGFKSDDWLKSSNRLACGPLQLHVETKQGAQCVDFEDMTEELNPCSEGQTLTKLGGRLECVYPDIAATEHTPDLDAKCDEEGKMLVQSDTGFVCLSVEEAAIGLPTCQNKEEVFVKTNLGFECISKDYVSLVCEDGSLLVRDQTGFRCSKQLGEVTKIPRPPIPESPISEICRQGEVLVVEGGLTYCKRLEHNAHLCGAGFKPRPREMDGSFVCAPEKKHVLDCPEGYHKTNLGTECLPVAPHVNLCKDQHFQELFGQQVDCNSGNLSAILVPCEEGYELDQRTEGLGDIGPMCRLTDYVNIVCEEEQSCHTEHQQKSCGDNGKGDDSPCLALLRKVFAGCQPQCANGGSCQGDVCVCPPGLTGVACEEDLDECTSLKDGHCQHGCVNTFGSFHCGCPFGYTLNSDRRSCKTIDCIPDCLNGGVCVDGLCQCPIGLQGNRCQSDINECETGSHGCQVACRNTFSSFQCICGPLTRLGIDGKTCYPRTDSCLVECRNGGKCENHYCACPPGFYGIACQLDVNECLDFNPGCSHTCLNTKGSYSCRCPSGMALLPDMKTCRRIITS